jgi:ribosome-associated protein
MKRNMQKYFSNALSICYQVVVDKKCTNLKIFDVQEISGITNYIILATCTSEPHLQAIRNELYQIFKHQYSQLCHIDYQPLSGWMVFDAFEVMVHAFTEIMRKKYNMDQLFEHANILNSDCILSIDIHEKNTTCKK